MSPLLESACPQCGRAHDAQALVCALCGNVLAHERPPGKESSASALHSGASGIANEREASPPLAHSSASRVTASLFAGEHDARFDALRKLVPAAPQHASDSRVRELRKELTRDTSRPCASGRAPPVETRDSIGASSEPWIYLAIGLATAPIFAWTPLLKYMGWFLASLVHEMGHASFAWLCGMPAVPAISLDGHAAAVHSEQSLFLVALIAFGLGAGAWRLFTGRTRWIALAMLALIYPAIALTSAKDLLHLLAGHGAELAFATLCLWKTLDGGFTDSKLERGLYGTVGWFLLGKNVLLCFGLMHSAEARAEYDENGSFGFTNDYLRVAHEVLGCSLERVALGMLIAGLLVLPAAFALWHLSRAMREA
jgi:hypothetical protein